MWAGYYPFNSKPLKFLVDEKIFQTIIFPVRNVSVDFIKILVKKKFVVLFYFVVCSSYHLYDKDFS